VSILPIGTFVVEIVEEPFISITLDDESSKFIAGRIPDNQDFIIDGKV